MRGKKQDLELKEHTVVHVDTHLAEVQELEIKSLLELRELFGFDHWRETLEDCGAINETEWFYIKGVGNHLEIGPAKVELVQ